MKHAVTTDEWCFVHCIIDCMNMVLYCQKIFHFKILCVHIEFFVDILDRDDYNHKSYISVSQNCGMSECIAIYIQQ